jgi:hypothetical protein
VRDVPLTGEMVTALWNARSSAVGRDDEALIFPARNGGFLDRGTVYGVVKRAAKTAGVPWTSLGRSARADGARVRGTARGPRWGLATHRNEPRSGGRRYGVIPRFTGVRLGRLRSV